MKKIAWITADYFIDVDIPVVPSLKNEFEIDWFIFRGKNSNVNIPDNLNASILNIPFKGKNPMIIKFYSDFFKRINIKNYDYVYIDYVGYPFFYFALLRNFSSDRIIHAAHNIIPYKGWSNRRGMALYLNNVFKKVQNFHIFSKFLYDYFKKKYPNKNVFLCPLFLKTYGEVKQNINLSNLPIKLLFFGNIVDNKRLDVLINAYNLLPSEIKGNVKITIEGNCASPQKYIDLINGEKNINYSFKRVSDERVPELFGSHHYLVLPYENVAQSGPHMIAYNYSLPVIATNIEGFSEKIIDGKTGFLFELNNSHHLAKIITDLFHRRNEYSKIKNFTAEYVNQTYSSNILIEKYKEFLHKLR